MTNSKRKAIQIVLIVLLMAAVARLFLIYRGRHTGENAIREQREREQKAARDLDPNFYVVPKKLHAYDLQSAKQLTKQPAWVKEGYRDTYYPYDLTSHRADFAHPAGLLQPLEQLRILDVVKQRAPKRGDPEQVMAVFERDGRTFAVSVGQVQNGDFRLYVDDMFFIEDPHALYQWPADTWKAIEAHQVKPGMDEIQAVFALGMGVPKPSEDAQTKTVVYPNGGNQVVIMFRNGRAVVVQQGGKS